MRYLILIWLFISVLLSTETLFADEQMVEVVYVSGKVEVCDAVSECKRIEEGMTLGASNKIKTSEDAFVELAFDEEQKNIVRINSDTSVRLLLEEKEKLELLKGEVFSSINELPLGSAFEIRTPTAIAGVRGTEWLTKADEESTDVEAFEGELYTKGIAEDGKPMPEEIKVFAGHMTTVRRFKRPLALRRIPGKNIKRWGILREEIRKHRDDFILRKKPLRRYPKSSPIRKIERRKFHSPKFRR